MAALVLKSRFAGLMIEDDEEPQAIDKKKIKSNASTAKKPDNQKKTKNTNMKNQAVQGLPKKKKNKANGQNTTQQWELWMEKDKEITDGNYESELQEAILLSKLDFEEKKQFYKDVKKEVALEKKASDQSTKVVKKQKKKTVMSLDQFNDMVDGNIQPAVIEERDIHQKMPERDTKFFDRVSDQVKDELIKDKIYERVRNQKPVSNEVINRVQFEEVLEKKDEEILKLQEEVSSLKADLLLVKSRNKKLCNILGQAEMKDKAEIIVELEKLRVIQTELTNEVSSLHSELEKQRSKNQEAKIKDKKKKM